MRNALIPILCSGKTKSFFAILTALLSCILTLAGCAPPNGGDPSGGLAPTGGEVLIAYYSRTGTTSQLAEWLAEDTGGELFRIEREQELEGSYSSVLSQAQQEKTNGARPELKTYPEIAENCNVIMVGYPIWHGDVPMVILTFLEHYDLTGKTVIPFCTSGSSGPEESYRSVENAASGAVCLSGYHCTSASLSGQRESVARWVSEMKIGQGAESVSRVQITVGEQSFTATLDESVTARAFAAMLPLTLNMSELNGNEKYHYLPEALPTDAAQPGSVREGDLMLYGSNCIVLFYASFSTSYRYTRIGQIEDPAGLAAAVGAGNVTVSFHAVEAGS